VVLGIMLAVFGSPLYSLILIPMGVLLYLPMKGDYENGDWLFNEVKRTLKATPKPPKPTDSAAKAARTTGTVPRAATPVAKPVVPAAPKPPLAPKK
jgi:hypothetical protein